MKILKSPQKVLILFLSVLIVISFIMILRLEGKTAILQSRLDEHHKSLEKNKDVLDNLDSFSRMIKNSGISIDGNKVTLQSGQSTISLQNNNIDISSNGDIAIGTPTKSFVHIQKDGNIFIGPDNTKTLVFDTKTDLIKILHDGASLDVGKTNFLGGKKQPGILMKSPNGNMIGVLDDGLIAGVPNQTGPQDDYKLSMAPGKFVDLRKGKSKIRMENDDINIEAIGNIKIKIDDNRVFEFDTKKDVIKILHDGASLFVGKTHMLNGKNQPGILMKSPNGNMIQVLDDGFIAGV